MGNIFTKIHDFFYPKRDIDIYLDDFAYRLSIEKFDMEHPALIDSTRRHYLVKSNQRKQCWT